MNKKPAQNISTAKTIKLSLEQISEISDRQYNQAMKHVSKFNRYQQEKKKKQETLDSNCTFRPTLLTKYYKASNKTGYNTSRNCGRPQKRLNDWARQKNARQIQKILSYSVELQISKNGGVRGSIQKRKSPTGHRLLPKNLLTETISISSWEPSEIKNSYSKRKHMSQSTLFQSDSSKSKSYLRL